MRFVLSAVIVLIFIILYLTYTYNDLPDAGLMMLAVSEALGWLKLHGRYFHERSIAEEDSKYAIVQPEVARDLRKLLSCNTAVRVSDIDSPRSH